MPPRIRPRPQQLRLANALSTQYVCWQCRHASMASATTPAPPATQMTTATQPMSRYPPTQPPSHKPPEFRKSQLHRQYQSLLRSSPLMLLFQHNNLKSVEWMGIRRELAGALRKVDEELAKSGSQEHVGANSKIQVVQTGIFASAIEVVEFWNPQFDGPPATHPSDPQTASSASIQHTKPTANDPVLMHGLSKEAWLGASKKKPLLKHGLEPLLSGPLAILTLPSVSPQHVKAALSILSPSTPNFPAPKRRTHPGWHERPVQDGLQKLMLLGARVDGKVFDMEGARWVGGIEEGIDGLRAQLVAMLQGVGAGITSALEAAGRSLYVAVEGRRGMLEEEQKKDHGA